MASCRAWFNRILLSQSCSRVFMDRLDTILSSLRAIQQLNRVIKDVAYILTDLETQFYAVAPHYCRSRVLRKATSACGQNAASPGIATRSSASPRRATATCVLCWSSVPTMCSVRMGEMRPYDSGVCTWPRAEVSSPSLQYCFTASGSPRSHTSRSME
jgi:hypothetical protein